jgi:hypothetical protein
MMRKCPRTFLAASALRAAGCIASEQAYSGEMSSWVAQCSAVMQQPSASDAILIGQSTFIDTTDDQIGDAQATDCGRQVGANLVEWDEADRGSVTQLESVPAYSGWSWHGGFNRVSVPVPVTTETWRVHARYCRSRSLGGSPTGQAAPSSPPAVPAAEPQRHAEAPPASPRATVGSDGSGGLVGSGDA